MCQVNETVISTMKTESDPCRVGWNQCCFEEGGLWEGDFLGKKSSRDTSECNTLRREGAGIAFLQLLFFWKANFLFSFICGGYNSRLIPSPCPQAPNGERDPSVLSDLILATAGTQEPRWCLTRQQGQGLPHFSSPTPCSVNALLTLWIWCWGPHLNICPDHCLSWLLTFIRGPWHDLDHICLTLSMQLDSSVQSRPPLQAKSPAAICSE